MPTHATFSCLTKGPWKVLTCLSEQSRRVLMPSISLTWWALDEREGFSQSSQNGLVLTLVELPVAPGQIKGFLLKDSGCCHCYGKEPEKQV